ncbi:MAG: dephospho-CoA kinase [Parachlamydiaceae bacterium]
MLKLKKVAITGGLSCGKSTVCRILKQHGAYVVSADNIVHQLLSSDASLGKQIVHLLGPGVLVHGKLDRSRIADIVFHDEKLLKALEKLIHPAVYRELNRDYQQQLHHPHPPPLFIAEVPLLFESGGEKDFDFTVAVVAKRELCFTRFTKATGCTNEQFNHRAARQLDELQKVALADDVIYNDGTLADLQQTTAELYQKLIDTPLS